MSRAPLVSSSDLSVNRKLAALLVHKYKSADDRGRLLERCIADSHSCCHSTRCEK